MKAIYDPIKSKLDGLIAKAHKGANHISYFQFTQAEHDAYRKEYGDLTSFDIWSYRSIPILVRSK